MKDQKVTEKEKFLVRNQQLIELIKMDPKNKKIYQDELIEHNIRLVSTVLKKYTPYTEDQFQTGCIGLIIAAQTFDVNREVPFSSYACFLIERELHRAYNVQSDSFETKWIQNGGSFVDLDSQLDVKGDSRVSIAEMVADEVAEYNFLQLFSDFQLDRIFEEIIIPAIDAFAYKVTAQRSFDVEVWRKLEMAYILDMIDLNPVQGGLTFTKMAKVLSLSIQNVKGKHGRLMEEIKRRLLESDFEV